jgi:hypothetical protein
VIAGTPPSIVKKAASGSAGGAGRSPGWPVVVGASGVVVVVGSVEVGASVVAVADPVVVGEASSLPHAATPRVTRVRAMMAARRCMAALTMPGRARFHPIVRALRQRRGEQRSLGSTA